MAVPIVIENYARSVASLIKLNWLVKKKKVVGFDPISLIIILVPLIVEILKQIQKCREEKAAGEIFRKPGWWTRRKLWSACKKAQWPEHVTAEEAYDAILEKGRDTDDQLVGELYGSV